MQVKKIAKQMKEYERLGRLIDNLQTAINQLTQTGEEDSALCTLTSVMFSGTSYHQIGIFTTPSDQISVTLNSEVSNLIRSELKDLLENHLAKLKAEQNVLEV